MYRDHGFCSVCGRPFRKPNSLGICQRTRRCKREYDRRYQARQMGRPVPSPAPIGAGVPRDHDDDGPAGDDLCVDFPLLPFGSLVAVDRGLNVAINETLGNLAGQIRRKQQVGLEFRRRLGKPSCDGGHQDEGTHSPRTQEPAA